MSFRAIASLLSLGGAAVVVALTVLVSAGLTEPFDRPVIQLVRMPAAHDLLAPLGVITELGSTWAVTGVALIVFVVGVAIGPWRHGLIGAAVIGLAAAGNGLVKSTIARERPDLLEPIVVERGFSFPSGHSLLGMVAYGVLAVLISRSRLPSAVRVAVIVALGLLVALIGVSRIWLGVHYPTDVLAGWVAGGVIVLLYAALTRGVSREPAAAAVDVDPEAPRSDRPAAG